MNDQININGQLCAPLTATYYVIGRGDQCHILLPEDDARVSRRHATLQSDGQGVWSVTDLNSTNGTFVNGQAVSGNRVLQDGDCITIGSNSIRLLAPRAQPAPVIAPPAPEKSVPVIAPDESLPPVEFPFASTPPIAEVVEVPTAAPVTVEVPLAATPPSAEVTPVPVAAPVTVEVPLVATPPSVEAVPIPAAAPATVEVPRMAIPPSAGNAIASPDDSTPFDARVQAPRQEERPQKPVTTLPSNTFDSLLEKLGLGGLASSSMLPLWHLLTCGVSLLMVFSLFLPCVNFSFRGTYSYVQGIVHLFRLSSNWIIEAARLEPGILFVLVPLGTTIILMHAGAMAFLDVFLKIRIPHRILTHPNRVFVQSLYLLTSGFLGTLASLWLFRVLNEGSNLMMPWFVVDIARFVGIGILVYAFASFAAIIVGLMGLAQMNGKQGSGD